MKSFGWSLEWRDFLWPGWLRVLLRSKGFVPALIAGLSFTSMWLLASVIGHLLSQRWSCSYEGYGLHSCPAVKDCFPWPWRKKKGWSPLMSKNQDQLSPKLICTSLLIPASTSENIKTIAPIFWILWTFKSFFCSEWPRQRHYPHQRLERLTYRSSVLYSVISSWPWLATK